jgi:hypothetical protein
MTKLIYSTELDIPGPWLLDTETLLTLDHILDEEMGRLIILRDEKLNQNTEDYIKKHYPKLSASEITEQQENLKKSWLEDDSIFNKYKTFKEISVQFANEQTMMADSVSNIIREYSATEALPISFGVDMQCGEIRCKVSLGKYHGNSLNISVSPEEVSGARELFVVLRQWASSNMAPSWQRLWMKITSFPSHWFIWGFILWFAYLIFVIGAVNPAEEAAKARARQLIDSGISDSNLYEAIETSLMLQVKYYPGQTPSLNVTIPGWLRAWFVFGLIVNIILSIKPSVVIGIGKGVRRIKLWRMWLNIAWVTIPALLFASFGWPLIEQAIRALIK